MAKSDTQQLQDLTMRLQRLESQTPKRATRFLQVRSNLAQRVAARMQPRFAGIFDRFRNRGELEALAAEVENLEILSAALRPLLGRCEELRTRAAHLQARAAAHPDPPVRLSASGRAGAAESTLALIGANVDATADTKPGWEQVNSLVTQLDADEGALPILAEAYDLYSRLAAAGDLTFAALGADLERWRREFAAQAPTPEWVATVRESVEDYKRKAGRKTLPGPHAEPSPVIDPPRQPQQVQPRVSMRAVEDLLADCRDWAAAVHNGDISFVRPLMAAQSDLQQLPQPPPDAVESLADQAAQLLETLIARAQQDRARRIETFRLRVRLHGEICGEHPEIRERLGIAEMAGIETADGYRDFVRAMHDALDFFGGIANNEPGMLRDALGARAGDLRRAILAVRSGRRTRQADADLAVLDKRVPPADDPLLSADAALDRLVLVEELRLTLKELSAACQRESTRITELRSALALRMHSLATLAAALPEAGGVNLSKLQSAFKATETWAADAYLDDCRAGVESIESDLASTSHVLHARASTLIRDTEAWLRNAYRELERSGAQAPPAFAPGDKLPEDPAALTTLLNEAAGCRLEATASLEASSKTVRQRLPGFQRRIEKLLDRAESMQDSDRAIASDLLAELESLPNPDDPLDDLQSLRMWIEQCEALLLNVDSEEQVHMALAELRRREQQLRQEHRSGYHASVFQRASMMLAGLDPLPHSLARARSQLARASALLDAVERDSSRRIAIEVAQAVERLRAELGRSREPVFLERARRLLEEIEDCGQDRLPQLALRRQLSLLSRTPLGSGRAAHR